MAIKIKKKVVMGKVEKYIYNNLNNNEKYKLRTYVYKKDFKKGITFRELLKELFNSKYETIYLDVKKRNESIKLYNTLLNMNLNKE